MHLTSSFKKIIKRLTPNFFLKAMMKFEYPVLKILYKYFSRPVTQLETAKAKTRRFNEKFFSKYCNGSGLDIGYGGDILINGCRGFDFEHGDAQYLKGLKAESFDYVYSGHTLEHMTDESLALKNWWRVVKPGGYLILYIPHRDLYEKRKSLPSQWNPDHKHLFLLDKDEEPDTVGVVPLIAKSLIGYEIEYAKVCDEGYVSHGPNSHSDGEYSIEVVLKKMG